LSCRDFARQFFCRDFARQFFCRRSEEIFSIRNEPQIVFRETAGPLQGCQIFLYTIYQNEGKYTKLPQHYEMDIKYTK
jgi:hypothetical protein